MPPLRAAFPFPLRRKGHSVSYACGYAERNDFLPDAQCLAVAILTLMGDCLCHSPLHSGQVAVDCIRAEEYLLHVVDCS